MKAADANVLERASSEAVHFGDAELLAAIRRLAVLHIFEIRSAIASAEELFEAMAHAMELPDYFGRNWDALHDALKDLAPDPGQRGFVLVIHNAEALWRDAARVAGELVEVWLDAAAWWHDDGVPFHLVFVW